MVGKPKDFSSCSCRPCLQMQAASAKSCKSQDRDQPQKETPWHLCYDKHFHKEVALTGVPFTLATVLTRLLVWCKQTPWNSMGEHNTIMLLNSEHLKEHIRCILAQHVCAVGIWLVTMRHSVGKKERLTTFTLCADLQLWTFRNMNLPRKGKTNTKHHVLYSDACSLLKTPSTHITPCLSLSPPSGNRTILIEALSIGCW